MAAHPVGAARTLELLAVHDAGPGEPDCDGHPTRHYRIYAALPDHAGELGVARLDRDLCAGQVRQLLARYNP